MLAEMLLRCPVGCNFLWTLERDQVPLEQALAPEPALERATIALRDLYPWANRAARAGSEALERGAQLEGLAHEVASHPAIHWWAEPCNLRRQVLLTDHSPLVAEDEDPQTPKARGRIMRSGPPCNERLRRCTVPYRALILRLP